MATRIAINGFGRIGRLFYRALHERNFFDGKVEVVAINDIVSAENLAYLLKYDSVQGNMKEDVRAIDENTIMVGDRKIKTIAKRVHPRELPWKENEIDLVMECTGMFRKYEDAKGHVEAGAKRVVISAPSSDEDVETLVMGINHEDYKGGEVISNASCTTNCLTPLVHVLIKEGIGIEEALMTTNHSYTASQALVDGPSRKSFRDGRAAALNIIPASTGAAIAVTQVFPQLKGKITGMAFRVPTATVSVVDLTVRTEKETSLEQISAAMKTASETYLKNILGYTDEPVVSTDFIHDARSSIYDSTASMELNSRFFKLVAWYDNEWGYSNRLAELVENICE